MRQVSVKTVLSGFHYDIDNISKNNEQAWVYLMSWMEKYKTIPGNDEVVQFDFKGINVIEPWTSDNFIKFMQDELVCIKFWNSEESCNTIRLMCSLAGIDSSKVTNENITLPKTISKEERQLNAFSEQLQEYFTEENGIATFHVYKRFDQIGVFNTVKYITASIEMYLSRHKCSKVIVKTESISIQVNVIGYLAEMISNFAAKGIEVALDSNNDVVMNKIQIHMASFKKSPLSREEKLALIEKELKPGKVGMLIKYKDSRATDEFGRKGGGTVLICRVAIYQGMKRVQDKLYLLFRTYRVRTFFTKNHWAIEHDNELPEKLEYVDEKMTVEEFGMYDKFFGTTYHFGAPIQIREEDSVELFDWSDEIGVNGNKVKSFMATLPERIKLVFDDWGILYDKEQMEMYIEETKRILEEEKKRKMNNGGI